MTGLGFASLGVGGLFLCIFVFPAVMVFTRDKAKKRERIRHIIGSTFVLYLSVLKRLGVITLQFSNLESLQKLRGILFICNHPTLLDVVIIMSIFKNIQCVVKSKLWTNLFIGGVVRAAGYIRNDLSPELFIALCKEHLASGENLIIFPEGTRSKPGQSLQMQRGVGNLALALDADIQALTMECQPITLTKGSCWYDIPPSPPQFSLKAGRFFPIETYKGDRKRSLAVRALMRDISNYYNGYFGDE